MTTKGQRFCNRAFNSAVRACSNFLWMEANWVLQGTRTWSASVPIAQLVALGEKKPFDAALWEFRVAQGLQHRDALNVAALVVAQQFLDGAVSFEGGDQVLNLIWIRIADDLVEYGTDSPMPELAYKIYDAFDGGQYDHGDGKDPVRTYTGPRIARHHHRVRYVGRRRGPSAVQNRTHSSSRH